MLRDLPLLGTVTLSYVIARNPRVDIGYPVKSGYAYWPLNQAPRASSEEATTRWRGISERDSSMPCRRCSWC